jgi:hypothetical protein
VTLKFHQAIGSKAGGVGPGVSPKTALTVGVTLIVGASRSGRRTPGRMQADPNRDDALDEWLDVGVVDVTDAGTFDSCEWPRIRHIRAIEVDVVTRSSDKQRPRSPTSE